MKKKLCMIALTLALNPVMGCRREGPRASENSSESRHEVSTGHGVVYDRGGTTGQKKTEPASSRGIDAPSAIMNRVTNENSQASTSDQTIPQSTNAASQNQRKAEK